MRSDDDDAPVRRLLLLSSKNKAFEQLSSTNFAFSGSNSELKKV